ncbi:hypothetical protein GOBAR_DD33300 [Gossypium barbadense]|nr:hypothetical protein GOBAR_DD33300 [Gossypium barbadense]
MVQISSELYTTSEKDNPGFPSPEPLDTNVVKHDTDQEEVSAIVSNTEASLSTSNGKLLNEDASNVLVEHPSSPLAAKDIQVASEDHLADGCQNIESQNADVISKTDQERSQPLFADSPVNIEAQLKEDDIKVGTPVNQKKPREQNADTPPVQDHLEEASMESVMRNRELTETRMLQALREELASAERRAEEERVAHNATKMAAMEREVELEHQAVEASTALARIQDSGVSKICYLRVADERTTKAAEFEQKLALLEVECASLNQELQNLVARARRGQKKSPEEANQMVQAELQKMRVEMAAMKRDAEHYSRQAQGLLKTTNTTGQSKEARLARVCAGLSSRLQEYKSENAQLEELLIAERELSKSYEAHIKKLQKDLSLSKSEVTKVEANMVEALAAKNSEIEVLVNSMDALKKQAALSEGNLASLQEHMELEKRYRELTDLLYNKQTQLETMASEKAAAEFQLEKEIKRLQEAQVEVERSRVPRRASMSWEEDTEIKALEPLPLHHRHMAVASIQLQKVVKLLDSVSVRATRFLWRYPAARIILLCYLVFVHLFLMYLLHRLQEQADNFAARELAESMGLKNSNLP